MKNWIRTLAIVFSALIVPAIVIAVPPSVLHGIWMNVPDGMVKMVSGVAHTGSTTDDLPQGSANKYWNGVNVPGSIGPTGSQGAQGVIGPTGNTGSQGVIGPTGPNGVTGSQGVIGAIGVTGITGATGSNGSSGSNGATGSQGIQGITGPTGASSTFSYASANNSRALDSTFTPHATKGVFVVYTINIVTSASLGNSQSGTVELRSDTDSPPTTVRSSISNSNTVSILLTLGSTYRGTISYLVPPGHNVRLVSSGTATITITNQAETTITAI